MTIEQRRSREAITSSGNQEISLSLWKPKVRYRIQNSLLHEDFRHLEYYPVWRAIQHAPTERNFSILKVW